MRILIWTALTIATAATIVSAVAFAMSLATRGSRWYERPTNDHVADWQILECAANDRAIRRTTEPTGEQRRAGRACRERIAPAALRLYDRRIAPRRQSRHWPTAADCASAAAALRIMDRDLLPGEHPAIRQWCSPGAD